MPFVWRRILVVTALVMTGSAFADSARELAVSPCSYADPCGIGECITTAEIPFYSCLCPDGTRGNSCADDACFRCPKKDPCKSNASSKLFFSHCEPFKFIQCHEIMGCSEHKCLDGFEWDRKTSSCTINDDVEYYSTGLPTPNPCASNPCQNEAACIPLDPEVEPKPFICVCPEGFAGELCDQVDLCEPNPCNGGYCMSVSGENFLCLCNGILLEHFNKTCCYSCKGISPCSPQNTAVFGSYFDSCDPSSFVQCDSAGGCSEVSCEYAPGWDLGVSICNAAKDEDYNEEHLL